MNSAHISHSACLGMGTKLYVALATRAGLVGQPSTPICVQRALNNSRSQRVLVG